MSAACAACLLGASVRPSNHTAPCGGAPASCQHLNPLAPLPVAAAVDQRVYIFGGHVLVEHGVQEHGKRHRHFFNDLWCLNTVSLCALR